MCLINNNIIFTFLYLLYLLRIFSSIILDALKETYLLKNDRNTHLNICKTSLLIMIILLKLYVIIDFYATGR